MNRSAFLALVVLACTLSTSVSAQSDPSIAAARRAAASAPKPADAFDPAAVLERLRLLSKSPEVDGPWVFSVHYKESGDVDSVTTDFPERVDRVDIGTADPSRPSCSPLLAHSPPTRPG